MLRRVNELCCKCNREIECVIDIEENGALFYCPHCGEQQPCCSMCEFEKHVRCNSCKNGNKFKLFE